MLCIYCRNGDHEVPLPIDEPCSCICHGSLALTLKTGAGWLAVVLFIAFFPWVTGKQMNDINFAAGVLQPPLYDPKLDDAPNYGNTSGPSLQAGGVALRRR